MAPLPKAETSLRLTAWISTEDACARRQVEAALLGSGGNVMEMLVALAKTDHFPYRLASELTL